MNCLPFIKRQKQLSCPATSKGHTRDKNRESSIDSVTAMPTTTTIYGWVYSRYTTIISFPFTAVSPPSIRDMMLPFHASFLKHCKPSTMLEHVHFTKCTSKHCHGATQLIGRWTYTVTADHLSFCVWNSHRYCTQSTLSGHVRCLLIQRHSQKTRAVNTKHRSRCKLSSCFC